MIDPSNDERMRELEASLAELPPETRAVLNRALITIGGSSLGLPKIDDLATGFAVQAALWLAYGDAIAHSSSTDERTRIDARVWIDSLADTFSSFVREQLESHVARQQLDSDLAQLLDGDAQ